ncbi:biotin transporter BioY [Natronospora cellulosivora (SeqCode)]
MNNTRNMTLVAIFTALSAIGAFIRIPLPFVAITLQTIFVFMAGILLGKKLGALSQLIYVGIGLIGIPIFTEGGGPGYVLMPSFGYLIGFIVAAYIIGLIMENREVNYLNTCLASLAGLIIIYIIGVPYLHIILNNVSNLDMSIWDSLKAGMIVFLAGDLLKVFIVTVITPQIYKALKNTVLKDLN